MKSLKQFSSLSYLFLCLLLAGLVTSCDTDIPEVDNEKPAVRLTIQGPGLNSSMDNPPQEVWNGPGGVQYLNLNSGVPYDFTLIATDAGGVSKAILAMPTGVNITLDGAGTISTVGVQQVITLEGDPTNPLTGLVITGTAVFPRGYVFDFNVTAQDYGGESGPLNSRYMQVSAFSN